MNDYPHISEGILGENDIPKTNTELFLSLVNQYFPEAIKDGEVDFTVLREEMGEFAEVSAEHYDFTWAGKQAAEKEAQADIFGKTLRYKKDDSKNPDTTENLYIEGDNLEALKLLRRNYHGKIKMIYIDPPYNTGNDFVYHDDFSMTEEELAELSGNVVDDVRFQKNTKDSARYHTNWLNMMYPRLKVARELLTEDGVIFISIDDNEANNCVKVCNDIFGERNFVAQFPWQSRQSIQNDTDMSVNHEYIISYAKNRRQEDRRLKESNANEWFNHDSFVFLPLPLDKEKFDNPDNDPRGLWKADPMDAPHIRQNLTYPITNPNTGEQHLPPSGRCWRILPEKFASALSDGRIVFGKNGTGRPQMKVFYEEKKMFGSIDNSWWTGERFGTATQGTKEMIEILGEALFDTPKPTKLLYCILKLVSNSNDNDIILDFFSGSATTAHAVMQLNAEDGGHRKFIMVQLPEICDEKSEAAKAGYKNICEIGKERIRRAGEKIVNDLRAKINSPLGTENGSKKDEIKWSQEQLKIGNDIQRDIIEYRSKDGENKNLEYHSSESLKDEYLYDPSKLDIGFNVFEVGNTNIRWNTANDDEFKKLEDYDFSTGNKDDLDFTPGHNDIDIVYEIMLRQHGIPLSTPIEKLSDISDRTYIFADAVVVCLEPEIDGRLIEKLSSIEPTPARFILRDSAFNDDIELKDVSFRKLSALIRNHQTAEERKNKYNNFTVEFI